MITGPGIGNLSALADHDFDTVILIDTEIANTDFLKNSHSLRVLAINDEKNNALYQKYKTLAAEKTNLIFGGRLGEYKYYDMDQVVASALDLADKII